MTYGDVNTAGLRRLIALHNKRVRSAFQSATAAAKAAKRRELVTGHTKMKRAKLESILRLSKRVSAADVQRLPAKFIKDKTGLNRRRPLTRMARCTRCWT